MPKIHLKISVEEEDSALQTIGRLYPEVSATDQVSLYWEH
jgi:hypothetical protein